MSKVTLKRPGWEGHGWSLHNVFFTIKFDGDGEAQVEDDAVFKDYIEPNCRQNGVTVERPKAAPPAPKTVKAKAKVGK